MTTERNGSQKEPVGKSGFFVIPGNPSGILT